MKQFNHKKTARAGLLIGAGLVLAVPAQAGNVTVKEGETAHFQVTVTPKGSRGGASERIRLWYDTDGGTAIEGGDYEAAHSWKHHVVGRIGSPVTISVKTFEDDTVEGDETFNIRMRKVEVQARGRWGHSYWRTTPNSRLDFNGAKSATIADETPRRQYSSYEEEKYGPNYTGQVWGE